MWVEFYIKVGTKLFNCRQILIIFFKQFQEDGEQNEAEGTELIDKNTEPNAETTQSRIILPNPFRKSKIEEDGKIFLIFNCSTNLRNVVYSVMNVN